MINLAIGESKVVVMSGDGKAVLFNEKKGHWDKGVWYSNHSYQPRSAPKYTSFSTQGYGTYWGGKKSKSKPKVHSNEIVGGGYTDPHASNRGKGRSWIDDLEDATAGKR